MTNCKSCNKEISVGMEYCDECEKKNQVKSNESYLDSLLNSVSDSRNTNRNMTFNLKEKKLKNSLIVDSVINNHIETDDILVQTNDNIVQADDNIVQADDRIVQTDDNIVQTDDNIVQADNKKTSDNIIDELNIDSEGNQLLDYTTEENNYKGNNYNNNYEDTTIKDKEQTNLNNINNDVFDLEESEKETTESQDDDLMALLDMITGLENSNSNKYDDVPIIEDEESLPLVEDNEMLSKSTPQDNLFIIEDDTIHFINDLDFDGTGNQHADDIDDIDSLSNYNSISETDSVDLIDDVSQLHNLDSFKEIDSLNDLKINSESNDESDIFSIDDFIDNKLNTITDTSPKTSDFSNVFSNSISAIDSLADNEIEEINKVKKKTLFQKLFGPPEEKEEIKKEVKVKVKKSKKKTANTDSEDASLPKMDKNKKSKKKNSKIKGSKNKSNSSEIDEDSETPNDLSKAKKKGSKNIKYASKEEKKANKQKKKTQDIILDEIEEEVKINKIGASIIFVFFGMIGIIIIFGANIFTYSLNIGRASTEFNRNRYTEAYNYIYGAKVHSSDQELYEKIITVMYVNKQLNSYYNYMSMDKKPEALDSLLKGLERYEIYIDKAVTLGIKEDMDYVHSKITEELVKQFNITEEEGLSLVKSEDQLYYSNQIYNIATGN